MKKILFGSVLGFLVLVTIFIGSYAGISDKKPSENLALGQYGGGSYSTTTEMFGLITLPHSRSLKVGPGVLRNVVITNETIGSFNLYDATTTNHVGTATTTLTKIYPSLIEGTYVYNAAFTRGLLFESQSSNIASSTITWD